MGSDSSSNTLPRQSPCLSYWQRTTRGFPYLFANKNNTVPSQIPYVIIGSGISGALTAFELLEAGVKGEDIIILEAREAASGASSRNAGHALDIISNERLVLHKIKDFVNDHNVQCDFNFTTTFEVCMTEEFAEYEKECLQAYKQAGGDTSHIQYYEGHQAKEKTRIPDALAAYEWPAGSINPAKLTHFLLQSVTEKGVQLYTFCAATALKKNESAPHLWDVHTVRGTVTAGKIIHCTNAHAALLLPQLEPYITPNRAQAHSLVPTPAFAAAQTLRNTYSLRYSLYHFYSLIQIQGNGTMVLGASRSNPTLSAETLASRSSTDDSHYNQEIADDALDKFHQIFSSQHAVKGEGLDHSWTGIIAMTPDSVPFVGAIESLPGQYICAGFNGHGMARMFTSAPGVVKLALGYDWNATGLPQCFQFSRERLARLSGENLPSIW
ncbi:hypothetical protein N7478_012998 [Penicillium angulare]|uniref:uncharacterized protein n=1 Tax=Penicillium angulare TaxID=116970 RepID=UPI00253FF2DF|nr:uncharacterized protein N7478_012998 [Penicillium angulare]KAJ5256894.1 hypothetical protein N7478_012998 [Penicillium angulare]